MESGTIRPALERRRPSWLGFGRRQLAPVGLGLVLVAALVLPALDLLNTSLSPLISFDQYGTVFSGDQPFRSVIVDTFVIAGLATLVTAAIGLPLACFIAARSGWVRGLVLLILIIPFFTGILVKNFAWSVILQDNGIINDALVGLGITAEPVTLLFTDFAVVLGMTHYLLPLFVLPVVASLTKLDQSLVPAARSLGASRPAAFRLVTLPLARPGIVTGSLVTFIVALGFYVTPAMLGGQGNLMVANVIDTHVRQLADFAFAAALAAVLLVVVLALLPLALRYVRPEAAGGESLVGGGTQ